jgi:hypothetical protein
MMSVNRLIAAGAISVALSPAVSLADPVIAGCSPTRIKYAASDALRFRTTSTSYVDLPQARVAFHQGGASPSCVLVRFSAAANASRNMGFRAMLDGNAGIPFEGQISDGVDKGPNVRRFTFIFPDVSPGGHVLQMQYQMTSQGGFADMNAHNTIVQFRP